MLRSVCAWSHRIHRHTQRARTAYFDHLNSMRMDWYRVDTHTHTEEDRRCRHIILILCWEADNCLRPLRRLFRRQHSSFSFFILRARVVWIFSSSWIHFLVFDSSFGAMELHFDKMYHFFSIRESSGRSNLDGFGSVWCRFPATSISIFHAQCGTITMPRCNEMVIRRRKDEWIAEMKNELPLLSLSLFL